MTRENNAKQKRMLENDVLIVEGLKMLIEKKLRILEEVIEHASKNDGDIYREVKCYFRAEEIIKQEGINTEGYRQRYHKLIDTFWKKKSEQKKEREKKYNKK